jgi:hypothetical protein
VLTVNPKLGLLVSDAAGRRGDRQSPVTVSAAAWVTPPADGEIVTGVEADTYASRP